MKFSLNVAIKTVVGSKRSGRGGGCDAGVDAALPALTYERNYKN